MTGLAETCEDYLRLRRSLGYKLERAESLLADFVAFCDRTGAVTVTTELALAWATLPAGADPCWWAQRLGVVRGFAAYLQSLDAAAEVPPAGLLPARIRRAEPYLYSDDDVAGLMAAARRLRSPLRQATYATLVGLLAATGLRVGEAIRLDRDDVCWEAGLLTVRRSKLEKSRQLPLHPTTLEALRGYARRRDQLCPEPKAPSFFVSTAGTRLIYCNVWSTFAILVAHAGLEPRSQRCRPRIHDLRHAFAVATLVDWHRAGLEVEPRLPLLSTWLGHVDPKWTYWYLPAAPELLGKAAERLASAWGQLG